MLYVYYFEKFKGAPTLLLAGNGLDIACLLEFFKTWSGDRVDVMESLGEGRIQFDGLAMLVLDRSMVGPSSIEVKGDIFEWKVSDTWKKRIVELLQGLADTEGAAHQYLDNGEASIQILCSKDEYGKT